MSSLFNQFQSLQKAINHKVVGQPLLVERLLIGVLADGHLLVEGAPGLAKTRVIKALADGIEGDFHRVQFTPDLLPSDLTGGDIYHAQNGSFEFQPGPIFHNVVLADEINRAPAKVQSALLEAMAERQVTIGKETYPLPELFLVMATQNPLEQEGTYPLPEAQLDRFLFKINVDYPDASAEREILRVNRGEAIQAPGNEAATVTEKDIHDARQEVLQIHLAESLEEYLIQLILATRDPGKWSDKLGRWIEVGASPRATIGLDRSARARAWLAGRDYVSPGDVQELAADILRHRLILSFEAEADGVTADQAVRELLKAVPVP